MSKTFHCCNCYCANMLQPNMLIYKLTEVTIILTLILQLLKNMTINKNEVIMKKNKNVWYNVIKILKR